MRVGSLFSGIGGFDLGLYQAGHRILFQCELDPYRRSVLHRHFPMVPCYCDIRNLTAEQLRTEHGDVDLLCGGFPCQDVSVARRGRQGFDGERSSLFYEFARLADGLVVEGGWVLLENTRGLLSSHGGRDFGLVLATLAELGFEDIAWRMLDSRFFGVGQRRRRVYVLGRRAPSDPSGSREVLFDPDRSARHPTPPRTPKPLSATRPHERLADPLLNVGSGTRTTDTDSANYISSALDAHRSRKVAGLPAWVDGYELRQGAVDPPGQDGRRLSALGDAVTVPVAQWIGERLATVSSPRDELQP